MYDTTKQELTEREKIILELLAKGYERKDIANMLFVSYHTVKAHISSILRKLKVKNRTQAVYNACKLNFIE